MRNGHETARGQAGSMSLRKAQLARRIDALPSVVVTSAHLKLLVMAGRRVSSKVRSCTANDVQLTKLSSLQEQDAEADGCMSPTIKADVIVEPEAADNAECSEVVDTEFIETVCSPIAADRDAGESVLSTAVFDGSQQESD